MVTKRGQGEGSIWHRKDGRWVGAVSWGPGTDGRPRRKVVYGASKPEVHTKLLALLQEKEKGAPPPGERLTVESYLQGWLARKEHQVQGKTYRTYRGLLIGHVIPVIGKQELSKLKHEHIEKVHSTARSKNLTDTSIHHLHTVLKCALTAAVREGRVGRNVAEQVKPPRSAPSREPALTREQARRLVRAANHDPLGCLYILALTTGMRQGELLALKWREIDLRRKVLSVVGSLERVPSEGLRIKEPKSAHSRRQIQLTRQAIEALSRHHAAQEAARAKAQEWWRDQDLVFTGAQGQPLDGPGMLRRSFYPFLERTGLPRIQFRDLRSSAATLISLEGVNPKEVADLLGHSDTSITLERYTRISSASHGGATRAMEAILADDEQA